MIAPRTGELQLNDPEKDRYHCRQICSGIASIAHSAGVDKTLVWNAIVDAKIINDRLTKIILTEMEHLL